MDECKRRIGNKIKYARDMYEAVLDTDAIFHITEWKEFRMPSWEVIKKAMRGEPVPFDGRSVYTEEELGGIKYIKIG